MLSIIVVTTDRLSLVRRLFTSLAAQTCQDFEILYVYGPTVSAETAANILGEFAELSIKSVQSIDHCLSRSRNLALTMASGSIIAFADDDCAYEPDAVAELYAAFNAHQDVQIIMSRIVDFGQIVRQRTGQEHRLNIYAVFKDGPTSAHFYKAEVVRAVGEFDESLGPGAGTPFLCGEDTDYIVRALRAGFSAARIPAVVIRHPRVNLHDPRVTAKAAAYAAGRMRVLRKHKFPFWFLLANVFYPLFCLPMDCLAECGLLVRYRYVMFKARLKWLKAAKMERLS